MIEAEKLTKRYRPVTAVDGLTSAARPGHVTGFLGPNGAGMTSALSEEEVSHQLRGGTGDDPAPLLPTGSGLAGYFAADGHAGSRFSARQRQHRR